MSMKKGFWIGISLSALALGIWLVMTQLIPTENEEGARQIELPFAVNKPQGLRIKSGLECQEATNEKNAFAAYESVRLKLVAEQPIGNIEYLDCFLNVDSLSKAPADVLKEFTGSVFDSNVMYSYLLTKYEYIFWRIANSGHDRKGNLAWGSNSFGRSLVRAYDSTNEQRFIDLYVAFFDRLLSVRDSELGLFDEFHKKEMNSWGSALFSDDGWFSSRDLWVSHITHFSVTMLPATAVVRRIRADPELARHAGFADRVIQHSVAAYPEFDTDLRPIPGSEKLWYWRPTEEKFEATNHVHLLGQYLLNMYALTGAEEYSQRINDILDVFNESVAIDSNGLAAWNYHPYFQIDHAMSDHNAREDSEFVWKAGMTIAFLYQAESDGFPVNQQLLGAVTKTIVENVLADGNYALNFHPGNKNKHSRKRRKTILERYNRETKSITRYLAATPQNKAIPGMILETIVNRPDLFSTGWFGKPTMAEGYAYYLDGPDKLPETALNCSAPSDAATVVCE